MKERCDSVRLGELLRYEVVRSKPLVVSVGIGTFVVLTVLGAFVRISLPFTPVPITLQTFFVLLSGAVLGGTYGAMSQLLYIFLGAMGLPIFAGAVGGITPFLGPTGGYLLGFVVASWLVGWMLNRPEPKGLAYTCATFALASMVIYLLGCGWLMWVLRCSIDKAFILGVLPFLVGDTVKVISTTLIYRGIGDRLANAFKG